MNNQTVQTAPSQLINTEYIGYGFSAGAIVQIAVGGIIATVVRVCQCHDKLPVLAISTLMILFNITAITLQILDCYTIALNEVFCTRLWLWDNTVSHLMYTSFDMFMLYKTYAVSGFSPSVRYSSIALFFCRILVSLYDILKSKGEWDPIGLQCNYNQDVMSGIIYNCFDVFCDLYSTIVYTALVILKDNVIRSLVVTVVDSYEIYAFLNPQLITFYTYAFQEGIYTAAVNMEVFWIQERKRSYSTVSGQSNPSKKGNGSFTEGGLTKRIDDNYVTDNVFTKSKRQIAKHHRE
ncbi:hypothetical protein BCR33DRAFT_815581 [Rhizoclosmatium globosum]|uniref:G-protein coupled receptors family 1 profile domain-containing protein n=1 Tax=Rhizoclosmatium globosum TaxID=329046 RepID=A0A1Y2CDF7_9FUNG|nr:hypothetical protein BCR33DRAFT_815581 [Rhizoclosmatium globosum]|eukprot:ORY45090.1 hypothetical protein BCR33DRAFT_815581 [Rhizoclosmatium globosum]